jgi:hypothetical protein
MQDDDILILFVKNLMKHPSVFGGHIVFVNNLSSKREGIFMHAP